MVGQRLGDVFPAREQLEPIEAGARLLHEGPGAKRGESASHVAGEATHELGGEEALEVAHVDSTFRRIPARRSRSSSTGPIAA